MGLSFIHGAGVKIFLVYYGWRLRAAFFRQQELRYRQKGSRSFENSQYFEILDLIISREIS